MAQANVPPGLNPRDKRPGEPRTSLTGAGAPGGPLWVRPRRADGDGPGTGLVPDACWPPDFLQRVQSGGPCGPGCRSGCRRADDPRHLQQRRRRQPELQCGAHRRPSAHRRAGRSWGALHRRVHEPMAARSHRMGHSSPAPLRYLELLPQAHGGSRGRDHVVRA